jgi:hypothetical protein
VRQGASTMSSLTSPDASPAHLDDATTRIAEILRTYSLRSAHIADRPTLPLHLSQQEQRSDQVAVGVELGDLERETGEGLQRLEQAVDLALADERDIQPLTRSWW